MSNFNTNPFRLRFLGAAETVTGSKYFLTNDKKKILIDCGLFQGLKELRLKNWDRFPIDPKFVDAVVLTHATLALCQILLPDTGYIQEEAEWLNRKHLIHIQQQFNWSCEVPKQDQEFMLE